MNDHSLSGGDLSDGELSDGDLRGPESRRLSDLLHRAADGLHVPATPESVPGSPRRGRPRWLAAAVLLAVAALGATWLAVGRDDGERVDTGPADLLLAPEALDGEGIWRLPEPDSGLDLIDVQGELGDGESPFGHGGRVIAVDDVSEPTTWIAVVAGRYLGPELPDEQLEPDDLPSIAGAGVTLVRTGDSSPTGSSWFDVSLVEAEPGSPDVAHLTIAAGGIPDDEMMERLTTMVERFDPPEGPWPVFAALDSLTLPDELTHSWRDAVVPLSRSLDLTAEQPDGGQVLLSFTETGLTPQVASLLERLALEALGLETSAFPVTPRPEIGPGAFTLGRNGIEALVAFSRDGVRMSAAGSAVDGTPRPAPLDVTQQIALLNQLRAVTEAEFVAELGRLDIWTSTDATTTTVAGGPGD